MRLARFIAQRIHFTPEDGSRSMPPAVRIAIIGIALGMAVMILSVAIVVGFKQEVRAKVIGFGSHIQVTNFDNNSSYEQQPIALTDSLCQTLAAYPGVRHVERFATKLGILKTDQDFQGIVFKGVAADYDWTFFRSNLQEGRLCSLDTERASSEVIVSRCLADRLGLGVDDSFLAYFVQDEVRARKFIITGIYETGFSDYDQLFVLGDLRQIRRLNGWADDQVGGLELIVDDYDRLDEISEDLYFLLADREDSLYVRSVKELNPMIFNWLDLLDLNVVVILVLMLAVAGFTMVSGLLIIILGRTNMIGLLKALGQSNASVRQVFLCVGLLLIGRGMLWGNLIGLSLCWLQSRFHLIHLDPAVYYLDAVPISLSLWAWAALNLGALLASMAMMLAPTALIATVEPAKTIRFE